MEQNKIELIARAIRKECSSYSLVEWCETWGFTVEDFDKFLEYAARYHDEYECGREYVSNYGKCPMCTDCPDNCPLDNK